MSQRYTIERSHSRRTDISVPQHLLSDATSMRHSTFIAGFSCLLPRDILVHIARIIRLNVLLDVNENGARLSRANASRSCPVLARARNSTENVSTDTYSRQMLPKIPVDTFDVAKRTAGPWQSSSIDIRQLLFAIFFPNNQINFIFVSVYL